MEKSWIRLCFAWMALGFAGACGGSPEIVNTSVTPSSFQISGIASTANFTVTTDVLHLTGTITSVTASVEGQSIQLRLVEQSSIAGGERWTQSTALTLWNGVSTGTYKIDITADDSDGTEVTKTDAATVTITD